MPTRTQTSKRPAGSRFARPAGKPTQRSAGGRRPAAPRRPTMAPRRKKPQESGVTKAIGKVTGMVPGMGGRKKSKRGAARGRGKKGPAGLAALAGAAGLAMKNRARITSMIRGKGSSKAGRKAG
jgi:hypothetical protein